MNGRIYLRNGIWYLDYRDASGRHRISSGTDDEDLAREILSVKVAEALRGLHNIITDKTAKVRSRIDMEAEQVLDLWQESLSASGLSDKYVRASLHWVRSAFADCNRVADFTGADFNRYRLSMQEMERSDKTLESAAGAIRRFCKWAVREGYIAEDPTQGYRIKQSGSKRKNQRRFLLRDEWTWLERFLRVDGDRKGMDSESRRLAYETGIFTGLRGNELRQLQRSHLHLSGSNPFVFARRETTKNKHDAKQYISQRLAADLLDLVSRRTASALVFPTLPNQFKRSRMIRGDLDGARRLWLSSFRDPQERIEKSVTDFLKPTNEAGETFNFHCLRYTCGAWLCIAGVDVRTVQRIMRHSTIKLTVDTYGRLLPGAESEAIQKLTNWHQQQTG